MKCFFIMNIFKGLIVKINLFKNIFWIEGRFVVCMLEFWFGVWFIFGKMKLLSY